MASAEPTPNGAMNSQRPSSTNSGGIDPEGGTGQNHHNIRVDVRDETEAATSSTRVNVEQDQAMTVNERMTDPELCRRLYQAASKGDWKSANSIEIEHPGALTKTINDREETVLHTATRVNKVYFIRKLVNHLNLRYLESKNRYGNTAFCIAAASGAVDIAKIMLQKNRNLTLIRGSGDATPHLIAATYEHRHMVSYLLDKTPANNLEIQEQTKLLVATISADYYDIALQILNSNMSLALVRRGNERTPLHIMALKSGAIGKKDKPINRSFKCICKKTMMRIQARQLVIKMWNEVMLHINNVLDFIGEPSSMIHDAARVGNIEFLRVLIHSYPDLAWKVDEAGKSIFHIAVETRQESVFNLIYEMGEFLDYLPTHFVNEENSLLALAAKLPDRSHLKRVSGAAFQMHRELLWFKEVETIEKLTMRRIEVIQKVRESFTNEHKQLVEEGEKWMKKTASSCMLVSTLIAAIVFAACYNLPGGFNNLTDSPVFVQRKWFTVFVISDAIALMSSSSSILLFLSILTSRCAEDDFFFRLPLKLGLGLGTLFLSVLTMVMAFSASFFLSYGKDAAWVPLVIAGMAIVPVYCFLKLQFKLWADTMSALQATWLSYFLFRNRKTKEFWMSCIRPKYDYADPSQQ